nr:PREDICTED: rhotekin-2 [Latimeria chalumnae]|eukprot:XP_014344945.1 PREDICTED: rhotekin-2 [Latimeria chalumnae]
MLSRKEKIRATVGKCSALGMEIKRKKIRESILFLEQEDCNIQEKIDFEVRMQEGIRKLLAASTQKEQVLNAAKNLRTCNTRISTYMAELQKRKELQITNKVARRSSEAGTKERLACGGKVAISDIRIPLMWKDSDHFNSKGRSQRVAVFCMLSIGTEVFDTEMAIVDKTVTDICFEALTIFYEARSDFDLKLEVYSCCLEEEPSLTNTPKKLAKKLTTSMGRSSGKKFSSILDGEDPYLFLQSNPVAMGAKYHMLAHATLTLESVENGFRTHSLTVTAGEDSSYWLPLYGSVCCRLVAQPVCMTKDMMTGFLNQQLKETRVRAVSKDSKKRTHSFSIVNPVAGEAVTHILMAESREELQLWMEAFWQHFYDISQWKHCCKELMKIEIMSPRKPPLFLTKEAASVYHDMSIDSPAKIESITDIIHNRIEDTDGQFLIGQTDETAAPPWEALFDGAHPIVVQKNILSPGQNDDNCSPINKTAKKRRAPPPPPDKLPYKAVVSSNMNPSEKENLEKSAESRCKTSSFDSKLSSIMQQLHRPVAPPRGQLSGTKKSSNESNNPSSSDVNAKLHRPVPVPRQRRKSIKEKLNPRSWLLSQV